MNKTDRELNQRWFGLNVLRDANGLMKGMNEMVDSLNTKVFEVQKIVSSKQYKRAEKLAKEHEEVIKIEQLERWSRAGGIVGSINQRTFALFNCA